MIMTNIINKKLEITKSDQNIFADLKIVHPEVHLAKVKLTHHINRVIKNRGMKQAKAAEILGVDQAKVSALSCGQLDDFLIDELINFLNKLDQDVEIVVKKRPTRRKTHGHLVVAFA